MHKPGWVVLLLGVSACGGSESFVSSIPLHTEALSMASAPCVLENIHILNFGHEVYHGSIDLEDEVSRILHGKRRRYPHDGTVFRNREHRLPDAPEGYYHEYVHPTAGISGPGPQRLIRGEAGEIDYTPDHYASFLLLDAACAASIAHLFAEL